jgi:hypothetical protein
MAGFYYSSLKALTALGIAASLIGCTTSTGHRDLAPSPVGAWASGDTNEACSNAPITYFSSDGVILVLLGKDGPIHSTGSWHVEQDTLTMTHNDFPLNGDGKSKASVSLEILELSSERFSTRNSNGDVRNRVKCSSIKLMEDPDHSGH